MSPNVREKRLRADAGWRREGWNVAESGYSVTVATSSEVLPRQLPGRLVAPAEGAALVHKLALAHQQRRAAMRTEEGNSPVTGDQAVAEPRKRAAPKANTPPNRTYAVLLDALPRPEGVAAPRS